MSNSERTCIVCVEVHQNIKC